MDTRSPTERNKQAMPCIPDTHTTGVHRVAMPAGPSGMLTVHRHGQPQHDPVLGLWSIEEGQRTGSLLAGTTPA